MSSKIQRLLGYSFAAYIRFVAGTIRAHIHEGNRFQALIQSQAPVVCVGFHGQHRLATAITRYLEITHNKPISGIVAGDQRQEMLESLSRKLGYKTYAIDMNENSFGSARELLRAINDLKSRQVACLVLAVDGPDGPVYVPKPGAAYIARRAEAWIVPMALTSPQAFILRHRWDQMAIPVPYSDVHLYFGQPMATTATMQIDDILSRISESIKLATKKVETLAARYSGKERSPISESTP
ncbi:MAG: hypothetical protein E4G99_12260 [Anaerolineales bacterium]|nr:MAG: hypothetical protein E4G99_12260 [Anaerolineales bacterium]